MIPTGSSVILTNNKWRILCPRHAQQTTIQSFINQIKKKSSNCISILYLIESGGEKNRGSCFVDGFYKYLHIAQYFSSISVFKRVKCEQQRLF